MKKITAKFNSICAGSGQQIKKGESIFYDPNTKKAYKIGFEPSENTNDDVYWEADQCDTWSRNNL